MTELEFHRRVAELAAAGSPFAVATVVWRRAPSSGRVGAKVIITNNGELEGWLGGACAEPTVVRHAIEAMGEGTPHLLFVGPPDELDGHTRPGLVTVPMACESEGAMEVYIEPFVGVPHVIAIGRSPAAASLARLVRGLHWRTTEVHGGDDLDLSGADRRTFIAVATQGHFDEDALEAALATEAGYIGLVASKKRASRVMEYLRDRGVTDEGIARLHAPAGLDLGSTDTAEIAVAILAEMVALKASGSLSGASAVLPAQATDPVCGMAVTIEDARHLLEVGERTVYFCAPGCKKAYRDDPGKYSTPSEQEIS